MIHFWSGKDTPNQEILSELEGLYDKDVITVRTIEKWTSAFDAGRTQLADLARSGRPHDNGRVRAVRALIEGEGYLSQKKIAQGLGIHHDTVKCILDDDLNMRTVNFKWMPHRLDRSQTLLGSKFRESSISWRT